nr:MAG TPA: hypothetical protein [Caudoviricetes sp.]
MSCRYQTKLEHNREKSRRTRNKPWRTAKGKEIQESRY